MLALYSIDTYFNASTKTAFENIVGKGEIAHKEQFLLIPQCFQLDQITVSPFFHMFDIISLFEVELEKPEIGISGKGLKESCHICHHVSDVMKMLPMTCNAVSIGTWETTGCGFLPQKKKRDSGVQKSTKLHHFFFFFFLFRNGQHCPTPFVAQFRRTNRNKMATPLKYINVSYSSMLTTFRFYCLGFNFVSTVFHLNNGDSSQIHISWTISYQYLTSPLS